VRDVYLVGKDDKALVRTIPYNIVVTESEPREYAVLVGQ
jgi:hypothetical protein